MKTYKYPSVITYLFILLVVVLLTACGGGKDNNDGTGSKKPTYEHPGLYFLDAHTQVSIEVELNIILT